MPSHSFQAPTGTRDLYPADALRRRYITEAWRRVSINHGFDEIDGPTFEHLDLYTVKSGEGIVSELFSFRRDGGEKDFALRPEFTPTLARMYAARAGSLPKPTRWFTAGPFFRAERPQRGRLREFLQWNCDVLGLALPDKPTPDDISAAKSRADVDSVAAVIDLLRSLGLDQRALRLHYSHREFADFLLRSLGVRADALERGVSLIDRAKKIDRAAFSADLASIGASSDTAARLFDYLRDPFQPASIGERLGIEIPASAMPAGLRLMTDDLAALDLADWTIFDPSIARGLAYYTGMVFEVLVDGERAVAGGGRYDNLVELFGGPATPAVGFGMGDVVLANILADRGLMPDDSQILDALSDPRVSYRPQVFVLSAGQTPDDQAHAAAQIRPLVARLRRGTESPRWLDRPAAARKPWDADRYDAPPMHARHSSKSTRNIGKLLKEAADLRARFAVIIESQTDATIKNLTTNEQDTHRTPLADLPAELARRLA